MPASTKLPGLMRTFSTHLRASNAAAGWSDLEARLGSNAELKTWADAYQAKFGEPAGTACKPILMAIDGQGFDAVAVLVTRCSVGSSWVPAD